VNAPRASEILAACRGKRVAVVGDLMLDRYVSGNASRISQEAPVPVVAVDSTREVPGGAANVVRNIIALGGEAHAFGVVGADSSGARLLALLAEIGAAPGGVLESAKRRTTEKTRVMANRQQVVRIDTEDTHPLTADEEAAIGDRIAAGIDLAEIDAVLVEDYAKGVVTEGLMNRIVATATTAGIPVTMDPHPAHALRTHGLTAMTPNRAEAFQMAGAFESKAAANPLDDRPLLDVAARIAGEWRVANLLITLGPGGMLLFQRDGLPAHIETKAREVFDVSGAGDTVIATLTLALASGAGIEDAADLANHAAGIVVGKAGTAIVEQAELIASFGEDA
jgi:D-glycero-beta-D-manno-heptose-7-phosphate kinase